MKVSAIEAFDKKLVGRIVEKIDFKYKIAILPDHYTPLSLKTHSKDPVPFIISSLEGEGDNLTTFSEKEIKKSGSLRIREGHKFMELFLKK
jgi:2,3-bisphosphoglycerate-independent phosphoglycerate mutase